MKKVKNIAFCNFRLTNELTELTFSRHCGNQVAKAKTLGKIRCSYSFLPGWRKPYAPVYIPGTAIIREWIPGLGPPPPLPQRL